MSILSGVFGNRIVVGVDFLISREMCDIQRLVIVRFAGNRTDLNQRLRIEKFPLLPSSHWHIDNSKQRQANQPHQEYHEKQSEIDDSQFRQIGRPVGDRSILKTEIEIGNVCVEFNIWWHIIDLSDWLHDHLFDIVVGACLYRSNMHTKNTCARIPHFIPMNERLPMHSIGISIICKPNPIGLPTFGFDGDFSVWVFVGRKICDLGNLHSRFLLWNRTSWWDLIWKEENLLELHNNLLSACMDIEIPVRVLSRHNLEAGIHAVLSQESW